LHSSTITQEAILKLFGIFSQTTAKQEAKSHYATDIHSHLIPGIDDGVKTLEESVSLIKQLHETGINRIITTPHIRGELYENTPDIILSGLEQVKEALKEQQIEITIEAAAEYYVDEYFGEKIRNNEPLMTFGHQKYILIEFSHFSPPVNYKTILFDLQSRGYHVVLAHPERYYYFHNNMDVFQDFYERGILLQLNLVSLAGFYDKPAMKIARKLIEKGFYSFAGSDLHNKFYLDAYRKILSSHDYMQLKERCVIMNDML